MPILGYYHRATAAHTTPTNEIRLICTFPAPLVPVALGLGEAVVPLAPVVVPAPVNGILLFEIANPVAGLANVIPVPLTHKGLVPFAPCVKFTPAHYD